MTAHPAKPFARGWHVAGVLLAIVGVAAGLWPAAIPLAAVLGASPKAIAVVGAVIGLLSSVPRALGMKPAPEAPAAVKDLAP